MLSGIIFINRNGLRWCDAPTEYGPAKTLYNRWKRWSDNGVFARIIVGLAAEGADPRTVMIDATYLKAHRTACSLRTKKGARPPDRAIERVRGKKKLSSGQFRPRTEHKAARRDRCERSANPSFLIGRTETAITPERQHSWAACRRPTGFWRTEDMTLSGYGKRQKTKG